MHKRLLGIFILLGTVSLAFAGGNGFERGNGGNVVFCKGESEVLFLDFYRYKRDNLNTGKVSIAPANGDHMQKVLQLLAPVKNLHPVRAALYNKWLYSFADESQFILDLKKHVKIHDDEGILGGMGYLMNCRAALMIFQPIVARPGGPKYLVDSAYWDMISEDQKATAILHEIVLREFQTIRGFKYKTPVQRIVTALLGYHFAKQEKNKEIYLNELRKEFDKIDAQLARPPHS